MGSGEFKSSEVRTRGIVLVSALSGLQSILRLVFFYLAMTGAELLEVEIASSAQQMINIMFLFIGVVGLITAFGLYRMRSWGYWGTILLSVLTIAFDIWGLTIQSTAAMGLILPVIFIIYLLSRRSRLQEMMH
jgi:uncharacterized membrane protein (DUF2068 family)